MCIVVIGKLAANACIKWTSPRFSSCVAKEVSKEDSWVFNPKINNYNVYFSVWMSCLGCGILLNIYMDKLNLNRATPPIPHTTILSPCMLTPYRLLQSGNSLLQSLLPPRSLSAAWVSSPISSPMKLKTDTFSVILWSSMSTRSGSMYWYPRIDTSSFWF